MPTNNENSYYSGAKVQGNTKIQGNVKFLDPMGYNS